MKKVLLGVIVLAASSCAWAGSYTHNTNVLPPAARATVTNYFKGGVSVVKLDKTLGQVKEYEVTLNDGTHIEFDRNGNWKDIEAPQGKSVPKDIVPAMVLREVTSRQPRQKIESLKKTRRGYEVELNNGVEMKFNSDGKFLRYDD